MARLPRNEATAQWASETAGTYFGGSIGFRPQLATRKAFAVVRIADAIEQKIGPPPEAAERLDRD